MTVQERESYRDILLGAVCIVFGIVMYAQTLGLPAPRYDPLGPAFVPRALSLVIIACACVILYNGIRRRLAVSRGAAEPAGEAADPGKSAAPFTAHPGVAAFTIGLFFLYILALHLGLSGFRTITIAFILLLGGDLLRFETGKFPIRHSIILAVLALVMGFGLFYLFTRVFVVDLY